MIQNPHVIAIECVPDSQATPNMLAEIGTNYVTDGTWRCTRSETPVAGWNNVTFDASAWARADVIDESTNSELATAR